MQVSFALLLGLFCLKTPESLAQTTLTDLRTPRFSPGFLTRAVLQRFPFNWVLFWFSLLLFQRLFDSSSDSDIPKNVPFTLVINTLLPLGFLINVQRPPLASLLANELRHLAGVAEIVARLPQA